MNQQRIYLAHNFAARDYLNQVVKPLIESQGHIITSRWIWDDSHLMEANEIILAHHDLEDIISAGWLFLFVDQFSDKPGKGKFVEFGFAIHAGKRIVLIGQDRSCIFYNIPNIYHFDTIEEALKVL